MELSIVEALNQSVSQRTREGLVAMIFRKIESSSRQRKLNMVDNRLLDAG